MIYRRRRLVCCLIDGQIKAKNLNLNLNVNLNVNLTILLTRRIQK